MSHIHYKFSSKLDYDTVVFDRLYVNLKDLKSQIMGREKLRAGDCDLQITNAQSKEEYKDDDCSIPKGSSVIVRRIPVIGAKSSSSKTRHVERSDVQTHQAFGAYKAMDDQSSSRAVPFFSKMANLADVDGSEEDKIKAMMNQSSYGTLNYTKKFGTVLPANYTCYRCGNTGHHIRNCPVNVDKNFQAPTRIKKSTGIPRSFMVEVDDPNTKGAMLTSCGRYAVPTIDIAAYAIGKKERPPFLPQERPETEEEEEPVSEELLCLLCHDLLSDAVVIPCCGNSYCDDCIRTALLDSEDHVCPTCSRPDVSPDNLIANKFLRQAVDYFQKEQGVSKGQKKGCGASQPQNPALTPSPAQTPPPVGEPSLPRKLPPSTSSQQDPLLHHAQAAHTPPPVAQVCVAPPTATGPASSAPAASLQPAQSHLEEPDKEAEEKTSDDSAAAAAPSVPVSSKDPTDAPSQPIPVAKLPPQTVGLNVEPPSSATGPAPKPSAPPPSWESSSSSSSLCPPGGWNESSAQQPPPSVSSYPSTPPPPLFPSPHFHTFLAAQQPPPGYPPGFPPTPPLWALPTLQGSPIPSLCPSASIPALIPSDWFQHQRKKERSPHGGSSHRRSSSRSGKFKSSRSFSRSSSRSRSRSRSHGRSRVRVHSPYSRRGDLHSRSTSSRSYSYGYKRSPTPSSSSSPRVAYRSGPKAAAEDRGKSVGRSRHHGKKSSSSSYGSRRRGGEHRRKEARPSGGGLQLPAQRANQSGGPELDRERYLQWSRDYKEWCDKYFSSYVGHFHQLPAPLLNIPPPPQWGGGSEGGGAAPDPRGPPRSARAARPERRSPRSRSSSDSRSSPSRSSRDSRSTPSRSSSDSRSSPSRSSYGSRSSRSSGSTPSKKSRPVPLAKGGKVAEPRAGREDEKKANGEGLENLAAVKHKQEKRNGGEEESSSPDAADSTDACRKEERRRRAGPDAFKDRPPARDEAAAGDGAESGRPLPKPDRRSDKVDERKSRERRTSDKETGRRRGRRSDSRPEAERRHKDKKSRERDSPGDASRSERSRKRKGEDVKRSSLKDENSKSLKANTEEEPKPRRSESPSPFDRKKPKMEKKKERKTWPLTEKDIWEGGARVKPQKKININIKLDGNRKEEGTEKERLSYSEKTTMAANGEMETKEKEMEKETEKETEGEKETENEEVDGASEEKITPDEGDARQKWEKATFRDDEGEMLEKTDLGEKEDFDLWHGALRGEQEKTKESEKQGDERDGMEAGKGEELSDERGVEAGPEIAGSTWEENRGDLPGESKEEQEEEEEEEEDTLGSKSQRSRNQNHQDGPNSSVDHGSSGGRRQQSPLAEALEEDHAEVVKVPRTEREEEERRGGVAKAQADALASSLPSETRTSRDSQKEERRERSVERERGREREKSPVVASSHRRGALSSGRDRNDSAAYSDRERRRDRGRERESKRSREGEKGRDGEQQRKPPSSSQAKSHGEERRQERDAKSSPPLSRKCSGGRRRESRAPEPPQVNTHTSRCQEEEQQGPPGGRLPPPPPSQSHEGDPDVTPDKKVEKEERKPRPARKEDTNGETGALRAGGGRWEGGEGEGE